MAQMGTITVTGPYPETTCICGWTTHTGTLRSALALAAASLLGAGSLMPPPVNHSHTSTMMLTQSSMKQLPVLPWDPLLLPLAVPPLKPVVEFWRNSPIGSSTTLPLCTTPTPSACHRDSPPATRHAPVSLMKIGSALGHLPGRLHVPPHPVGRGVILVPTFAILAHCLPFTHPLRRQDPHQGAALQRTPGLAVLLWVCRPSSAAHLRQTSHLRQGRPHRTEQLCSLGKGSWG